MSLRQQTSEKLYLALIWFQAGNLACPWNKAKSQAAQGVIGERYSQLGGSNGPLGSIKSNEMQTPDGKGRYNPYFKTE